MTAETPAARRNAWSDIAAQAEQRIRERQDRRLQSWAETGDPSAPPEDLVDHSIGQRPPGSSPLGSGGLDPSGPPPPRDPAAIVVNIPRARR